MHNAPKGEQCDQDICNTKIQEPRRLFYRVGGVMEELEQEEDLLIN